MKASASSRLSACAAASSRPEARKAWFTSATLRRSWRTAPLSSRACQERTSPGVSSTVRAWTRAVACAGRAALPTPWARATAMAERVMLSPITISVTVAPLTMSTGGGAPWRGGVSTKFRPT